MKEETNTNTKISAITGYRFAYFTYLALVSFQLYIGEYEWAVSNFGIALVFDPFDASIKWEQRPTYQKVWLLTHLTLLISGVTFIIFH